MGNPTTFSGFTPIPIVYSTTATHYIYARSHSTKKANDTLPSGRTLFLVNVPPDATERDLIQLFKNSGTVEKVVFSTDTLVSDPGYNSDEDDLEGEENDNNPDLMQVDKDIPKKQRRGLKEEIPKVIPLPSLPLRTLRKTGGSAHLVFLDDSSHDRAVDSLTKPQQWPKTEESRGLAHYLTLYDSLRPPLDLAKEHADTYIELYEYELAKQKQNSQYKKGEAIVDEDGFTLVTRGGAYGQTLGGGVAVANKKFQQSGETRTRNNRKKEKKEKEGFYAFQKAEKQRKEILELKRRWEEDKAKVERLKASRRFKPY